MEIGRFGVWTWLDATAPGEAAEIARKIERWGYSALWIPEAMGADPFVTHTWLAAQTERLILATGIANIYARDAMAMRAGRDTLGAVSRGRFLLGLGVSHAPMVAGLRGHEYGRPVATMRTYLENLEKAQYAGPTPPEPVPVVLAALRPKMLGLAAQCARGAHPYNVTPEHTARAREILGPQAWLCPEQKVLLETNPRAAREVARSQLRIYLSLPNYQNNWKWLGFGDADFADGGSERLVDSLVAWGDEQAIRARLKAHHDAGADHVCIQPLRPDGGPGPDLRALEALAPAA
jgi:probable F420-dependent oxidoreductase